MQGLPVILKWHTLQSLDKALDLFIELKICKSDVYFLNRTKTCMVATYNFGSVYTCVGTYIRKFTIRKCLMNTLFKIRISKLFKIAPPVLRGVKVPSNFSK